MGIRPIDLKAMVPKTTEIARVNQETDEKLHANQQQANIAMHHQSEREMKKVNATEQSSHSKIDEKQREKHQHSKDDNNHKNNEKGQNEDKQSIKEKSKLTKGNSIDIRV